jgi:hypothetical protein
VPVSQRNTRSGFEPESHGTVICQRNFHIGAELAGFNLSEALTAGIDKSLEVVFAFFGRRSLGETGASTLPGVCRQRELRNKQQAEAFIHNAAVHTIFVIGKHPVTQNSVCKPCYVLLLVIAVYGNKNQKAALNPANDFAIYRNGSVAYALQKTNHFSWLFQ